MRDMTITLQLAFMMVILAILIDLIDLIDVSKRLVAAGICMPSESAHRLSFLCLRVLA